MMLPGAAWRWSGAMACVALAVLIAGCTRAPAEKQIRSAIVSAATAARAADAHALGEVMSDDFDGNDGTLDSRALLNMLRVMRLRGEQVSVVLGPVTVEPRGRRFIARFTVTLGGGGRVLPDRLGVYRVETAWREEGGDWRCYQARWKRRL